MTVLRNEGRWDTSNAVYADGRVVAYDKVSPGPDMHWIDYGLGGLDRGRARRRAADEDDLAALYGELATRGQALRLRGDRPLLRDRDAGGSRRGRRLPARSRNAMTVTRINGVIDGSSPAGGEPGSPRVGVLGLWHLGCITAACLAEAGFDVVAVDPDPEVVAGLRSNRPPVGEPGLAELVAAEQGAARLRFDGPEARALGEADVLWVAFDTPVDEEDRADSELVIQQVHEALGRLREDTLVVVSSQLPVGSVARLESLAEADGRSLRFACVPENLRLGEALDSFRSPERFVAGVRDAESRERLAPLLTPFTDRIEWMGVESAEMTKHALNGFLATSVAYINEIAVLRVGWRGRL